jgi:hypothetical protein
MSSSNQTIQTRVVTEKGKADVQFRDSDTCSWEPEIELSFKHSGKALFILALDVETEPYVFYGAFQTVLEGGSPDTNWDFAINGKGNTITFTNDCKNKQTIGIRLALIPRDAENPDDSIISADPKIKNEPD